MECSWNPTKKQQTGFAWNVLETPIQVCRGASILYCNALFFFLCWRYLKPQVRINKMVNSIDYYPYPSRSASKVHPFIFLKTTSGFISFQDACWIFSETFIYSTICGENFQIYGVHIPRKCIESRHFYSCCSPLKTLPQVLVIAP